MLAEGKTMKLVSGDHPPERTEEQELLANATVGKYELGQTLGEGNFGTVKIATHVISKEQFAIKIINKEKIAKHGMEDQILREVLAMKRVKHPNVVQLQEVMASKSRIYMVLELVTGGELRKKVKVSGRMQDNEGRMYFRQLINAIDFCHSRGVYHRDLKPENLLLDSKGHLKVSDFGLSALAQNAGEDGLLHTKCGTRGYIAPEVLTGKGYRGETADLFSCGAILHFILAGFLPFPHGRVRKGDFALCKGFSPGARRLVRRMLDPDPDKRITIPDILRDGWFNATEPGDVAGTSKGVDSTAPILSNARGVRRVTVLNAFDLISRSEGLSLSNLLQNQLGADMKHYIKFTSKHPAKVIISTLESAVKRLGFNVQKSELNVGNVLGVGSMKLQNQSRGRKGQLKVETQVLDLASQFAIVEISKADGDTLEFHKFYKNLTQGIKDIIWDYHMQMAEIK